MSRVFRVAYLVSHPIQYQAPLLRSLTQQQEIDLTVLFLSDFSTRHYFDRGFGSDMKWDIPLLDGYHSRFLPVLGGGQQVTFWRPFVYGLSRYLREKPFDALWMHGYAHQANLRALAIAKQLGIKTLLRGESHLSSHQRSSAKEWLRCRILPKLFNSIDGFLSIGTLNHDYYVHYGVSPNKIFPMPYAVDNVFFREEIQKINSKRETFRQGLGLEPGHAVILFVSKFQSRKRPMDLLLAYARLLEEMTKGEPEPYLLFVGDGEEGPELKKSIVEYGLTKAKLIGFKNQTELPRFYDLCDVFVLPSEHEPWGLVVNEVMNAGKPVIVSDQVGAGSDLVQDGVNGYIIKVGDVSTLARRIDAVLSNPGLAKEMGRESRRRISGWSFNADACGLVRALEFVTARNHDVMYR
ncbi:glycosyltransferase family 4 protein [Candidatus Nitrospira salsa]